MKIIEIKNTVTNKLIGYRIELNKSAKCFYIDNNVSDIDIEFLVNSIGYSFAQYKQEYKNYNNLVTLIDFLK
jgi:hypothetical protein